ncbi:DNA-3-methyladenine glycosylase 2 family protein [Nakamurella sp. YIM 132087]|uniref:DNA-3-methyladenine glycosylase 2 family protein n=1 Tax=Nakamurella alba TaxID=2665158 RepID=A0A7K1FPK3_9ACTN|nr:DNA-3-methyladenine glycosylase 2 family protein [Nakamurella alba]MTD15279.1 DNA-3-methyladenine glycosylase 2 family protein [Nakamurella alba]
MTAPTTTPLASIWRPGRPVDLHSTLGPLRRGAGDPALRLGHDEAWRVSTTPAGPATLHLRVRGGSTDAAEVQATAWGPGAGWFLDQVPELLGEGDDWSELDVSSHLLLTRTRHRLPGLRIPRTGLVWESLAPAILEQKVLGVDAWLSYRQLIRRFGAIPPGPAPDGMRLFPTPAHWRGVPSWEFHRAGVDPKRAATAMRAARVADALERTLTRGRGGPEVAAVLTAVPGIGPWTAAEVMQKAHGDPDTVSVGDYHLAHFVGSALIGRRVDDDGMLELLEPWRGHRHRVVRLIECSGATNPRFGPRMARIDYRGI